MDTTRTTRPHQRRRAIALAVARLCAPAGMAAALACAASSPAWAAPQGGQVSAGQAGISRQGAITTISQTSARAAIDWQSFSLAAGETVRFVQPARSAVTLNRVLGDDASQILGRITANGQVLLLNPNGILFGAGAQVDVGGLVASTARLADADFMAGRWAFSPGGRAGAVVENRGSITVADGGLAALVGAHVANSGTIQARLGTVALAAGDAFVLDLAGDRLINLVVSRETLGRLTDSAGRPVAARLDQQGRILADGGRVSLSAASVAGLLDSVVNVGGVVRASSFGVAGGTISLRGDDGTRLTLQGQLDVSGTLGGRIEASAGMVHLAGAARIDASGELGGGSVTLGGLASVRSLQFDNGATVDVSARLSGRGGTVSIQATQETLVAGQVLALGGQGGGDGGLVSVATAGTLLFDGNVQAGATVGEAGTLLLGPANLQVVGSGGENSLPAADSTGDHSIRAAAINRQLANGTSVVLQATQDIAIAAGAVVDARLTSGGTPGASFSLTAGRDINVDGLVILDRGSFSATAGRDFTQAGTAAIATQGGAVAVQAGRHLTASNLLGAGAVSLAGSTGAVRVTRALAAARLDAQGAGGVTLDQGATISGAVSLASGPGAIDTRAATLQAGGAISLSGNGVHTAALISPAAVSVTSAGDVSLGPVAGAAGTVDGSTASAQGLAVHAAGAVRLNGAALGSAGLQVEGLAAGSEAASLALGGASIFSGGAVDLRAGTIALDAAGIRSGATLVLAATGGISSGTGKLESAGAAILRADGSVLLGSGGLEVTGAGAATLAAGGPLQTLGDLRSGGAVAVGGGGVTVGGGINAAGSYRALSSAGYSQAGTVAASAITIDSVDTLQAANLVTTGAVALTSGAAVQVTGPLAGGPAQPSASLVVTAGTGIHLGGGALLAGNATLSAGAGAVDTSAATLQAGAAISLSGASVHTAGLISPAAVTVTSLGDARLGPVAGAAGTVDGSTTTAQGLAVHAAGAVTLAGAALGSGGLVVAGLQDGSGAASLGLGSASVFSAGAVRVLADSIDLGSAGVRSGATLDLAATAGLTSGSGKLESAGAATLTAGTSLLLGSGGLEVTGASPATLTAGGSLYTQGDLRSGGAVAFSGNGITVDGKVNAAGAYSATSSAAYTQAGTVAASAIGIDSSGTLQASNLVTPGAISLTSRDGAVQVSGALAGGPFQATGSLVASGHTGVTLGGGALLAGAATLTSFAGAIDTSAATVQAGGAITLAGAGVRSAALLSPAAVSVTSFGDVSLGPVAGAPGTVGSIVTPARGLSVRASGAVTLGGAALGDGGLLVEGLQSGSAAGSLALGSASIFSTGAISARAGSITLASAGLRSGTTLDLNASAGLTTGIGKLESAAAANLSTGGNLVLGRGGLEVTGASPATLAAGGTLQTTGDLRSGGAVTLIGAGITVDGRVNAAGAYSATSSGAYTQGGTVTGASIGIDSRLALQAANLVSTGAIALTSRELSVAVTGPLAGGPSQPAASLVVHAETDATLGGGAWLSGFAELSSSRGTIDTTAATLQAGGVISLTGHAGSVRSGALITPSAVGALSMSGTVSLGPVAGAPGSIDANTPRAESLTVHTMPGIDITLAGAALGSGGLIVEGMVGIPGRFSLAGSSIFSTGAIQVQAASIDLGAGMRSGSTLTLTSAGGITSGTRQLESAGAATLTAGTSLLLGSGGLDVTGNATASLSATGTLRTVGDVRSGGAVVLAGAGITVDGKVSAAGAYSADSSSAYTQAGTAAASAVTIDSSGALQAASLVTAGAISLTSRNATVQTTGALAAGPAQAAASLVASGRSGVTLGSGALLAGTATLTAAAGPIDTSAATLQAGGAITLTGSSVRTAALVSPAAVSATSSGNASLGVVAGAAGTLDGNTATAQALTVRAPGTVTLGGAALGSGGLLVEGLTTGSNAGSLALDGASVFSSGAVTARAAGDIVFSGTAGLSAGGAALLRAGGALRSGSAALSAGSTLTGDAGTTLQIGSGGASAGGNLTLHAAGNLSATGPLKARGATVDLTSDNGSVSLGEVFTWETGRSASGALRVRAGQDVVLNAPLGGANTGYRLLADGYQPDLRPEVGAVDIGAGRDVELNGLNLDGRITDAGLRVIAGHRLVSNGAIGVNKGDIVLQTTAAGTDGDMDGIYLGNAVYSRGLDLGAAGKTAYNITIGGTGAEGTRGNLHLFDNTDDFASVPGLGTIAKIVVANNVANYKLPDAGSPGGFADDPALVEAGNRAAVSLSIGADRLRALTTAPAALRLTAMPTRDAARSDLAEARTRDAADNPGRGIGLKVQTFRDEGVDGDVATRVYPVLASDNIVFDGPLNQCDGNAGCYARAYYQGSDGTRYSLAEVSGTTYTHGSTQDETPVRQPVRPWELQVETVSPGTLNPGTVAYVVRNSEEGRVRGFVNRLTGAGRQPRVSTTMDQQRPTFDEDIQTWVHSEDDTIGYALYGSVVQVSAPGDTSRVARMLFAPGALMTQSEAASFNTSGGLNGGNGNVTDNRGAGLGGGANSNAGFSSVGAFGGLGTGRAGNAGGASAAGTAFGGLGSGSAGAASGNGSSSSPQFGGLGSGQATGGGGNASGTGVAFGSLAAGQADGGGGNGSGTGVAFGSLAGAQAGAATGNGFTLPAAGSLVPADDPVAATASTLRPLTDLPPEGAAGPANLASLLVLGSRPAALADLGRGSASAGAVPNVFRARFRVARTPDNSVCAPADVEPTGSGAPACAPGP